MNTKKPTSSLSERVSSWLRTISLADQCPICGEEECSCRNEQKFKKSSFRRMLSNRSRGESNNVSEFPSCGDPDFTDSLCSDSSCLLCTINSISSRKISILSYNYEIDDDLFDNSPTKGKRQRSNTTLSTVSVKINGFHVEKVKWNKADSDLLLKINSQLFPVHRSVIFEFSPKIKKLLDFNQDDLILELHENINNVRAVLELIYGCKGDIITNENVHNILSIAVKYEMASIEKLCFDFLNQNGLDKGRSSKLIKVVRGFFTKQPFISTPTN